MGRKNSLQSQQSLPAKKEKRDVLQCLAMPYDPGQVEKAARKELECRDSDEPFDTAKDSVIAKALTLREFDHGVLLAWGLKDEYQTFAVQLSRDYQEQYKCGTAGRKSLAELAVLNYCRTLEIQRRINNYLGNDSVSELGVKYLAVMSKELDRAQRQYMSAIQTLEMGMIPPMKVNVKAGVANIGNQQMIQENNDIKAK